MENSEDRLIKILKELQNEGSIEKKRQLKKNLFTGQIQGIFNKIRYNEKFYKNHLSNLNDNQLKYVLLHEEGHIIRGCILDYIWLFIFVIGGICIFYWPIRGFFDFVFVINGNIYTFTQLGRFFIEIFSCLIYILIIFPLLYRLFYSRMYHAEFKADEYAANCLREKNGISNPSAIMKETFEQILSKYEFGIKEKLIAIILQFIGFYPGYHPSEGERILNIKNKFDVSLS